MTPIRLAFIGLSKVGWAPKAHLPYILSSPDYEIVAICNSSIESAKEAIQLYKLPGSVKAYGDPEGLSFPSFHLLHLSGAAITYLLILIKCYRTSQRSIHRPSNLHHPRRPSPRRHLPLSPCRERRLCRMAPRQKPH